MKNWPIHLFFLLMRGMAYLPYPVLYRLGIALGWLMFKLAKSRTQIAEANIVRCFPGLSTQEHGSLIKANLLATGVGMVETAMLWFGPKRRWESIVEVVGMEHLERAKQQGKGGLLLAFHLTSLEIGGSLLGTQTPIAALYRKNENPLIEQAMVRGRQQFVHPIARENTREMIRWIKNNGFVWYAADQDYGREQSIFVPFFGIPTATITATSRFVKLTKAPVIPMTQERVGKGKKLRVTLHPPLQDMGVDERVDAITINQMLEKYLKQHPSDYLWIHRRFKTRPQPTDESFYAFKKKGRPITPELYQTVIDSAQWIEKKNGKPYRLKREYEVIYFVYRSGNLWDNLRPPFKAFIKQLNQETHDGTRYLYQGLTRYCGSEQCDLVFLHAQSDIENNNSQQ